MEGRRGRRRQRETTLLPLQISSSSSSLSNTISCWYCDLKICVFNQILFRFGRSHFRFLRAWFSIGVGFSLTTLVGTTMICAWESAKALNLFGDNTERSNIWSALLFGYFPSMSGMSLSLADAGYILVTSLLSISAHEFGHAVAATSGGIQVEYIAIFLAVLFPGALVAFNSEMLQALPRSTALRVYCAGIWHNAVCCAVSGLALFLLPLILYPLYIHGENPMVLDVSSKSPLSTHLAHGDVIVSLDGMPIRDVQEWSEIISYRHEQTLQYSNISNDYIRFVKINGGKGYCVPVYMIEEHEQIQYIDNQPFCPNEFTPFVKMPCFESSVSDNQYERREFGHCLNTKDIIKLKKCGNGWMTIISNGNDCTCSEDETCLSPIYMPGMTWIEIIYTSPYSRDCLKFSRDSFPSSDMVDKENISCGGTFVFAGDVMSLKNSVQLTSYQPRWNFSFGANIPSIMEKFLMCTFHVSLALALINSLPVYFLDGEYILEIILCYFTMLSSRKRRKILQACLLVGTAISILAFFRIFLFCIM